MEATAEKSGRPSCLAASCPYAAVEFGIRCGFVSRRCSCDTVSRTAPVDAANGVRVRHTIYPLLPTAGYHVSPSHGRRLRRNLSTGQVIRQYPKLETRGAGSGRNLNLSIFEIREGGWRGRVEGPRKGDLWCYSSQVGYLLARLELIGLRVPGE